MKETPAFDTLMNELLELKKAQQLLYDVWLEVGPYGAKEIPMDLLHKINDFFGFDDSEQACRNPSHPEYNGKRCACIGCTWHTNHGICTDDPCHYCTGPAEERCSPVMELDRVVDMESFLKP